MQYQGLELDPFQEEAFKAINENKSVIITAPTGCGKTLIAEYAAEKALSQDKKIIFTAPIKALSNQKFRDFRRRFGESMVGIHTGDVSLNPDGTLLIMTTEIFRNLILEQSPRLRDILYVIFDEIHYLDDEERGTVWEESIMLAPKNVRFLCLSATVPNIDELAAWMSNVCAMEFVVIKEYERPVPLRHHLFSAKYGQLSLSMVRKIFKKKFSRKNKFFRHRPSSKRIVEHVLEQNHVPILYFCFNRKACERNAYLHSRLNLLSSEEHDKVRSMVDYLIEQYRIDNYDRLQQMRDLWESGCAFHHAGILPSAKEIVERLFTAGLIKLLFCTETFALGINMPASAVIFDELEKFNGVEFEYLSTRQYHQMGGRAGRRGMDKEGHVYSQIIPETTDPVQVERILYHQGEPIRSRFVASYATILNLYSRMGEGVYDLFRKSLRNFKRDHFANTKSYLQEELQIKNRIDFLQSSGFLDGCALTKKGMLAAAINGYEIQSAELYHSRSFDECSPAQLCVVVAGLVTEEKPKRSASAAMTFSFSGERVIHKLRQKELKYNIRNPIREMTFSLAAPVYAWANGCSLTELESFGIPEGDLVRLLRMSIQVLRSLRDNLEDPVISDRMHDALELINRDVVDAEAELDVF